MGTELLERKNAEQKKEPRKKEEWVEGHEMGKEETGDVKRN